MAQSEIARAINDEFDRSGIVVSDTVVNRLSEYWRLLAHWNRSINLTSFDLRPSNAKAIVRLLVEPVSAARFLRATPAVSFDFGSGGGSPAIPIRIVNPSQTLVLVESRERKAAFLSEAARELGLAGVVVENARIDEVASRPGSSGRADLVTVRAVRLSPSEYSNIHRVLRFDGQALLLGPSTTAEVAHRGLEKDMDFNGGVILRKSGV